MEEQKNSEISQCSCDIPPKEISRMYLCHFGVIFSNMSIVGLVVGVMALLSSILVALGTVISVMILAMGIIMTLGAIFAIVPNYMSLFSKAAKILDWFPVSQFATASLYILPISIALSIASIVLLSFDKQKKHTGRIIFSGVVLAFLVVVLIALIIKGRAG